MFALVRVSEGLLIAHLVLAASFLVGSSVFPWCDRDDVRELAPSQIMMRVIATCGFGMALFGFVAFALALVGLFRPAVYFPVVFIGALVAAQLWGASSFSFKFWSSRWDLFARSWELSTLIVYLGLIALALPAVVLNIGGSDPVGYHLVYAYEWAKAGRLVVDPFLRLPFYASNFPLLFSVLMSVGAAGFVNFLSWSVVLLTALGVCSTAEVALYDRAPQASRSLIAVALALSVLVSPAALRWMDTAYIDAAIGAFALISLLCVLIALSEKKGSWLVPAAASAGFLIGTKGSFLLLFPVFVVLLALAARRLRITARFFGLTLGVLLAAGSPWYVRNIVMAGDPVPPALNVALYGRDGLMTKGEWKADEADLGTPKSPSSIASLPFRAFVDPQNRDFREYGTTALMLLLYLPAVVLLILFARGKRAEDGLLVSSVFVSLLVAYWVLTSSLLRYSTLFYPALAVAIAYVAASFLSSFKRAAPVVAVLSVLAVLSSPGSGDFFHRDVIDRIRYLPASYVSDDDYLSRFSDGYKEASFVSAFMHDHGLGGRVYTLGLRSQYDFARDGEQAIGDWMGAAGYFRLYRAVDARAAVLYLDTLNVHAIVIAPTGGIRGMNVPLERQLLAGGFCPITMPGSADRFYVLSNRACGSPS